MKLARFRRFLSVALLTALAIFTLSPMSTSLVTAQDDHGLPAGLEAVAEKTLRTTDGRLMVMIELTEAPVIVTEGGTVDPSVPASASAISRSASIVRSQDAFVSQTAGMSTGKFDVLGRTTYLINTVSLAITEADLAKIAQLSEIKTIYPVIEHQLDLGNATGYTSTAAAWSLPGNFAGQGQVVAVIDSGVDFTNPDFGGNGAYPAGGPNSAPRITAPTFGTFPLGAGTPLKLVGGYDYAGDSFTGSNVPVPDPNPIDCRPAEGGGHGTHVAGISTGYGVNGSTTYPGPWDSTTPFASLNPAPGFAPRAALLGMRVFGCSGSTTSVQVTAAMSDAVAGFVASNPSITFPRANVINMSLGSQGGYGGADGSINPYVTAVANAMNAGTVVVMSAGNNGDTHFITGSPGSSPAGVSVASVLHGQYNAINVTGTTADGNYPVQQSVSSPMNAVVGPYPLAMPTGNGCAAANYSAFPANRIALVFFSTGCGSAGLMTAAQASPNQVMGLLVVSNVAGQFQNLGCAGTTPYIPCVSLQPATGTFLQTNLGTAQVTLDPSLRASAGNLMGVNSSFTSRGPAWAGAGAKPDLASTGDSILSAASGQTAAPYSAFNSGTSMSSPAVAGMVATIRSNPAYSAWTAGQLKSLIMNTATTAASVNDPFGSVNPMIRYGAGVANTLSAVQNQVIVYNTASPDVVSVNFGSLQIVPGAPQSFTRSITIENRSTNTASYNVGWVGMSSQPGVTVSVSPSTVSVAPGSTQTLTITVNVDYTGVAVPHANTDPTRGAGPYVQAGLPRHWLSETTGYVGFTPTSQAAGVNQPLRLNVYATGRAASDISAPDTVTATGLTGTVNIPLTGTGLDTGTSYPSDILSMVTALRLMGEDPVGDTLVNMPMGDIQYVGVSNDANGNITGTRYVYFGVAMASDFEVLQSSASYFEIYLDYNNDDVADHCMFTITPVSGTSRTDVFVTALITSGAGVASCSGSGALQAFTNDWAANTLDTYVYYNNVAVFPVRLSGGAGTMGRSNASPNFRFRVVSYAGFQEVDSFPDAGWLDYNPNQPILNLNSAAELDGSPLFGPQYFDDPTTIIPVTYDLTTVTTETPAILLLHHHNGTAATRPEIVRFGVTGTGTGISVTHTATPSRVDVQGYFNYTVTVTNESLTGTADNVVMTDVLPDSATIVIQAIPPGCSVTGQTVTCSLGTLPPGGSQTFVIQAQGVSNNTVTAFASATTTSLDLDPTNNTNIPATVEVVYGAGTGTGTGTGAGGTGPIVLPSTGYEQPVTLTPTIFVAGVLIGLLIVVGAVVVRRRR